MPTTKKVMHTNKKTPKKAGKVASKASTKTAKASTKKKIDLKGLRREVWTVEGFLHVTSHLFAVTVLIVGMMVLPLWVACLLLVFEIWQLYYFKGCFLTKFANKRGFMIGMTFWEYVPYVFGIDDYKRANAYFNLVIRATILITFVYRIGRLFI